MRELFHLGKCFLKKIFLLIYQDLETHLSSPYYRKLERMERVELRRKLEEKRENKKIASRYFQLWRGLIIKGR